MNHSGPVPVITECGACSGDAYLKPARKVPHHCKVDTLTPNTPDLGLVLACRNVPVTVSMTGFKLHICVISSHMQKSL